jgi:ferredoxin
MTAAEESYPVELILPDGEHQTISVGSEQHIWDAAEAAGISLPALCHQGYCLTCAGRCEGEGEVDQSDSLVYFPEDREAGFILLCTGKPRSALSIRTHQQDELRHFRKQKRLPAPYSWEK